MARRCSNCVGGTHDGQNGSAAHGYQRAYNCSAVCNGYGAACAKGTACCDADIELCTASCPQAWSDISHMSCTSGWACGNLAASTIVVAEYYHHVHGRQPPHGRLVSPALMAQMNSSWKLLCPLNNPTCPRTPTMNYGLAAMQGPPGTLATRVPVDPSTWGGCVHNSSVVGKTGNSVAVDCRIIGRGGEEYGYVGTGGFLPAHDIAFSVGTNAEEHAFQEVFRSGPPCRGAADAATHTSKECSTRTRWRPLPQLRPRAPCRTCPRRSGWRRSGSSAAPTSCRRAFEQ